MQGFYFSAKAQTWSAVDGGINNSYNGSAKTSFITSMAVYKGELYVAGSFDSVDAKPANNIAKWNGTSWSAVGTGANAVIYALTVYDGNLYIGGDFTIINGVSAMHIAKWDSVNFNAIGYGINEDISNITIFNGNLIAGTATGGGSPYIYQWNGTSWIAALSGLGGSPDSFSAFGDSLYAGVGEGFYNWTNTYWNLNAYVEYVAGSYGDVGASILSYIKYNSNLYVGGSFGNQNCNFGVSGGVSEWNGTSFNSCPINVGVPRYGCAQQNVSGQPCVRTFAVYNGDLYAGGTYSQGWINDSVVPLFNIVRFDGTNTSSLGSGITLNQSSFINHTVPYGNGNSVLIVDAMAVYDSSLYVGGCFDNAGGIPVNNIARWKTPTPTVAPPINNATAFSKTILFPSPNEGVFSVGIPNLPTPPQLEIFDDLGQKIISTTLTASQTQIDLSDKAKGIYFYKVFTEDGKYTTVGKFILE